MLTAQLKREGGRRTVTGTSATLSHKAPNNLRMSERPVVNDHSMDEVDGGEADDHSLTLACV